MIAVLDRHFKNPDLAVFKKIFHFFIDFLQAILLNYSKGIQREIK